MDIMEALDLTQEQIDSGEISGNVIWPVEDIATFVGINVEQRQGKNYLVFKLKHNKFGNRDFLVKIPGLTEKENVRFMAMQRIYACLHSVAGIAPGEKKYKEVYNIAQSKSGVKVKYVLREYEQVSERTGKMYKNQSLDSLEPLVDKQAAEEYFR